MIKCPCDSYNSLILGKDSFKETIQKLDIILNQKFAEEKKQIQEFTTKNLKICEEFPVLKSFTFPFQRLIAEEMKKSTERQEEGKQPIVLENGINCSCEFYRKYCLPCKHLFQIDNYVVRILTTEVWDTYLIRFAGCGFEVYYGFETEWIPYVEVEIEFNKIEVYSKQEEIKEIFYNMDDCKRQILLDKLTELVSEMKLLL